MDPYSPEDLVVRDGSAAAWRGSGPSAILESILDAAEQLAPRTHVGICVANTDKTFTTLAGSDPLVFMLDAMQYDLGEGPALAAMQQGYPVIVDDAESERRWPRFASRAAALGLRSFLGVPIVIDGRTLGGLNMYSTTHTPLDAGRLAHARLFASAAAIGLRQTSRENDLVLALQSSRTIGKATGLVMERFDLDDHEAFAYLAKMSQRANIKLRDLAEHLVRQSNDLRHVTNARPTCDQQDWQGPVLGE